ncbi:MAG TPA: sigma 54-interacting transcriptional regulator [Gemmata sp.]|jgi:DNA-binding NtrC family response regulator|nr:sigma 54-interacting transcriptional regulator [Gemmata sp.]
MPESSNRKGRPRGSGSFPWRAFFQQSTTPIFVLGKGRRLRFANAAWEKLTNQKLADALGMVCSSRRHSTPLAAALAPTPEAEAGKPDRARRAAPTGRSGPPWWDVTFTPLAGVDEPIGIVGFIAVVGESAPASVRKIPPMVADLRDQHARAYTLDLFTGNSPTTERFAKQLRLAADSPAPVWLTGEVGSGKETAARVIHHTGPRRDKAFFGVACGGLQPYLIESLLFGHGGLVGTGHIGTIYLKNPSALPRDLQQKIADLICEAKPGTPRLISGSTATSADEVASGKLIRDFQTELSVLELRVPPLRERLADLPKLVTRSISDVAIDPAAIDLLRTHAWEGNLRELTDMLRDASKAASGGTIKKEHLPRELRVKAGIDAVPPKPKPIALDPLLEAVERKLIELAMSRSQGNATKAAEILGIFRARLSRRLEALGFNRANENKS